MVDDPEIDARDVPRLVNGFLCATPSLMVALSLEDIAGEQEPGNVPGVDHEAYPSWTRRLTMPVEALVADGDAAAAPQEKADEAAPTPDPVALQKEALTLAQAKGNNALTK